jgi:site-specific recombinase XerD
MNLESALSKLRKIIRLKHLSLKTEDAYVAWIARFSRFISARCREGSPETKMEAFLTQLAHQDVAASTQNQAFFALLFFYREVQKVKLGKVDALRAKTPVHIRYAPERHEVLSLLARVEDVAGYPTRLIVNLLYGCGLRVTEPLNLRLADVLLSESKFVIRSAKGGKDRDVPIPCSVARELQAQVEIAKAISYADQLARIPVKLPGLLSQKYPHWQFSPKWAWLFPARETCADPRSGVIVRWRCHEANVQRCVKAAAKPLGLDITPHHLRHAYATHCLNAGTNVRAIQSAMGHKQLETTMGYLHAEALSVPSPLDLPSAICISHLHHRNDDGC